MNYEMNWFCEGISDIQVSHEYKANNHMFLHQPLVINSLLTLSTQSEMCTRLGKNQVCIEDADEGEALQIPAGHF